jgi:hypothetical protein
VTDIPGGSAAALRLSRRDVTPVNGVDRTPKSVSYEILK